MCWRQGSDKAKGGQASRADTDTRLDRLPNRFALVAHQPTLLLPVIISGSSGFNKSQNRKQVANVTLGGPFTGPNLCEATEPHGCLEEPCSPPPPGMLVGGTEQTFGAVTWAPICVCRYRRGPASWPVRSCRNPWAEEQMTVNMNINSSIINN